MILRLRSLCFGLLHGQAVLNGMWKRVDDDFEGCLILVETTPSGMEGKITYVPPAMRRFGWAQGDIKWRQIRPGGVGGFNVSDLAKSMDPQKNHVVQSRYAAAQILFLRKDELALIAKNSSLRSSRWVRLKQASADPPSGTS